MEPAGTTDDTTSSKVKSTAVCVLRRQDGSSRPTADGADVTPAVPTGRRTGSDGRVALGFVNALVVGHCGVFHCSDRQRRGLRRRVERGEQWTAVCHGSTVAARAGTRDRQHWCKRKIRRGSAERR